MSRVHRRTFQTRANIGGSKTRMAQRGFCAKHYQRWKAHGDPMGGKFHHHSSTMETTVCQTI